MKTTEMLKEAINLADVPKTYDVLIVGWDNQHIKDMMDSFQRMAIECTRKSQEIIYKTTAYFFETWENANKQTHRYNHVFVERDAQKMIFNTFIARATLRGSGDDK